MSNGVSDVINNFRSYLAGESLLVQSGVVRRHSPVSLATIETYLHDAKSLLNYCETHGVQIADLREPTIRKILWDYPIASRRKIINTFACRGGFFDFLRSCYDFDIRVDPRILRRDTYLSTSTLVEEPVFRRIVDAFQGETKDKYSNLSGAVVLNILYQTPLRPKEILDTSVQDMQFTGGNAINLVLQKPSETFSLPLYGQDLHKYFETRNSHVRVAGSTSEAAFLGRTGGKLTQGGLSALVSRAIRLSGEDLAMRDLSLWRSTPSGTISEVEPIPEYLAV